MEYLIHPVEGGAELRFAHLTVYDLFGDKKKPTVNGFVPIYRKQLKAERLENLKAAEFPRDEIALELDAFDRHCRKQDPLQAFLEFLRESPNSTLDVVKYAYAQANDGAELPEKTPIDVTTAVFWQLVAPFDIHATQQERESEVGKTSTYGDGVELPNQKPPLTYSTPPMEPTEPGVVNGGSTGIARASA